MNVVLNGFFIERNNLNVFRPRFSNQKMYFVLKRFLPIVNEGLSLAILNEKSSLTYNFQICTYIYTIFKHEHCTYLLDVENMYIHTLDVENMYIMYSTYTRCRKYVHILDVENMSIY